VIEHCPGAIVIALVPLTEQTVGVLDVNMTARPDEADALSGTDPALSITSPIAVNVIDCGVWVTEKLCTRLGEAGSSPPVCLAVIEHNPMPTSVAVLPDTVQTEGVVEVNRTVIPMGTVATRFTGPDPNTTSDIGAKEKF
jgi:hypothetical protein